MNRLSALTFLLIVMAATIGCGQFAPTASAGVALPVDPQAQQAILDASVQIVMAGSEEITTVDGNERITVQITKQTRGVGTLVAVAGQTVIVTHDHWSLLDGAITQVEFRTADGALLHSTNEDAFRGAIRYRDGGTLILDAPAALLVQGLVPTQPPATTHVGTGQQVYVTHRHPEQPDRLVVSPAVVEGNDFNHGQQALDLRTLDGASIVRGDSGGGVWLGDQLIGNMWAAQKEAVTLRHSQSGVTWTTTEMVAERGLAAELPPIARIFSPPASTPGKVSAVEGAPIAQ